MRELKLCSDKSKTIDMIFPKTFELLYAVLYSTAL